MESIYLRKYNFLLNVRTVKQKLLNLIITSENDGKPL